MEVKSWSYVLIIAIVLVRGESVILVTAWQEEMGTVYREWRGSKFSWHEPDGRQLDELCRWFFEKSKAGGLIWHAYNVKLYLFLSLTRSLKFYEQHRLDFLFAC